MGGGAPPAVAGGGRTSIIGRALLLALLMHVGLCLALPASPLLPAGAKKPPVQRSRSNGPFDEFTVATRLNRASTLPPTSPANSTLTMTPRFLLGVVFRPSCKACLLARRESKAGGRVRSRCNAPDRDVHEQAQLSPAVRPVPFLAIPICWGFKDRHGTDQGRNGIARTACEKGLQEGHTRSVTGYGCQGSRLAGYHASSTAAVASCTEPCSSH